MGRGARTRSPPPRAACWEPEPLPVAPGPGTSTPVGPRESRNQVARALPEPVVPSSAALHSRKRERAGPRTTEAKVRVAAGGQSAPGVGLALRRSEVVGVGWEEIRSHTRGGLSCRRRRRECGVGTGAAAATTPGILPLAPGPIASPLRGVSAACSFPAGRPRLHFPPSLHHTHGPPDHGSGQWWRRWRRRRREQQRQQQQRLGARLLGPSGHGSPWAGPVRRGRWPLGGGDGGGGGPA